MATGQFIKPVKLAILLLTLMFSLSGCSQPLKLLMRLNSEDKALSRQLKLGQRRFDLLVRDIERGRLKIGDSEKSILARYGEPVLRLGVEANEQFEKLLYRYPMQYFNSSKVYLYFDASDRLMKWSMIDPVRDELPKVSVY